MTEQFGGSAATLLRYEVTLQYSDFVDAVSVLKQLEQGCLVIAVETLPDGLEVCLSYVE